MSLTARCACGNVEIEASGAPIVSAACYCDDCQEGSRRIEALPNAPPVLDSDGGTSYVLYRKDRIRYSKGEALLQSLKLKEKTDTNRVVAACCNSAMVMRFDDSKHWVPVFRHRLQGAVPPLDMRICTKSAPGAVPTDVPASPSFSIRFIGRLLRSRIAMLFGR